MKHEKEVEEEYGERDGSVSKMVQIAVEEGDEKYLVEVKPEDLRVSKSRNEASFDRIAVVGRLFKDLLKPSKRPSDSHGLNANDVRIYVEIDKDRFNREVQAACENSHGVFFKVDSKDPDSELSTFIPQLKDKETGEDYGEKLEREEKQDKEE